MIDSIKLTNLYKNLKLDSKFHAYLFYSADKVKNNEIALTVAKSIVCENKSACDNCHACKQFKTYSHPDVVVLEQDSIKVDDVELIIEKLQTKPIQADKKVFIILNAENINETAQNKLLKSLEEPTESAIFILTATQTNKLLPTVLSRLNKIYVENLSLEDEKLICDDLLNSGVDISSYIGKGFTLTEMFNFATDGAYKESLNAIKNLFATLNSSADIPIAVSNLNVANKQLFFINLMEIFLSILKNENKFDASITAPISEKFNNKAISKCLPLVEMAYKQLMSNVNFYYILDNLLFNMLKERFLCK